MLLSSELSLAKIFSRISSAVFSSSNSSAGSARRRNPTLPSVRMSALSVLCQAASVAFCAKALAMVPSRKKPTDFVFRPSSSTRNTSVNSRTVKPFKSLPIRSSRYIVPPFYSFLLSECFSQHSDWTGIVGIIAIIFAIGGAIPDGLFYVHSPRHVNKHWL